jgi:hypothetical protein
MNMIRLEARPDVIGRLRNAKETDRESRNAVVGPLAHLERADAVSKSKRFWTRSSSSGPGHRGGCLDPAGAIGRQGKFCGKKKDRLGSGLGICFGLAEGGGLPDSYFGKSRV